MTLETTEMAVNIQSKNLVIKINTINLNIKLNSTTKMSPKIKGKK